MGTSSVSCGHLGEAQELAWSRPHPASLYEICYLKKKKEKKQTKKNNHGSKSSLDTVKIA